MMKVTVERKAVKPVFAVGGLVELDVTQFPDAEGYVVMITNAQDGQHFSGAVVQSSMTGDIEFKQGQYSESFIKTAFVKFTGKLIMEQS